MECFIYSPAMRVAYVMGICLAVGLLVPWIINQQLQFTPESHDVPGTCHIMMGLRMNCFPDITNNEYVRLVLHILPLSFVCHVKFVIGLA